MKLTAMAAGTTATNLLNTYFLYLADQDTGKCGEWEGTVSTIGTWVQLVGATGVVHGSTLSLTRLLGKSAVMRWRQIRARRRQSRPPRARTTSRTTPRAP